MPDKFKSKWDANSKQQVAQSALRKSVASGRTVRPDACQVCDTEGPVFGHHWRGYEFPLDVWFVCISCNTRITQHDGSLSLDQARASVSKRKDNSHAASKLALRRYFLGRYHADESRPPSIFDCCQGSGLLWRALRQSLPPAHRYWGVDVKPKTGRLRIDSARILAQPGWDFDVIDIDTYGSPWKHWFALLPRVTRPTTVFLTLGRPIQARGGRSLSTTELDAIGCRFRNLRVPPGFGPGLAKLAVPYCLSSSREHGLALVESIEALPSGNARYFGIRLAPN